MPRIIETTVYQYDELNDKAKERARDWYREASAGENYFAESLTCVGGDFDTVAGFCGWNIPRRKPDTTDLKIHWSGFSSQGDGLCFEGDWRASDVNVANLKEHAPQDQELHRIVDALAVIAAKVPNGVATSRKHSHHYSHEHTVTIDMDCECDAEDMPTDEVAAETAKALASETRALMRWMYRDLSDAYNDINSDESVAEVIKLNQYDFTENGKRF